jgi:mono/diheme cytochrome c family protein
MDCAVSALTQQRLCPIQLTAQGERLARMQCAACHIVANNQELPPLRQAPTPSFAEIANRPTATEKSLQRFIATTHWDNKTVPMTMPDQLLTRDETLAVTRYILSMRKH